MRRTSRLLNSFWNSSAQWYKELNYCNDLWPDTMYTSLYLREEEGRKMTIESYLNVEKLDPYFNRVIDLPPPYRIEIDNSIEDFSKNDDFKKIVKDCFIESYENFKDCPGSIAVQDIFIEYFDENKVLRKINYGPLMFGETIYFSSPCYNYKHCHIKIDDIGLKSPKIYNVNSNKYFHMVGVHRTVVKDYYTLNKFSPIGDFVNCARGSGGDNSYHLWFLESISTVMEENIEDFTPDQIKYYINLCKRSFNPNYPMFRIEDY